MYTKGPIKWSEPLNFLSVLIFPLPNDMMQLLLRVCCNSCVWKVDEVKTMCLLVLLNTWYWFNTFLKHINFRTQRVFQQNWKTCMKIRLRSDWLDMKQDQPFHICMYIYYRMHHENIFRVHDCKQYHQRMSTIYIYLIQA